MEGRFAQVIVPELIESKMRQKIMGSFLQNRGFTESVVARAITGQVEANKGNDREGERPRKP